MKVFFAMIVLAAAACSNQARTTTGLALSDAETVTEFPPDTVPADAYANRDSVAQSSRDVIAVMFKEGTALGSKRKAVAAIKGRVIGGMTNDTPLRGFYVVRIARNASNMELVWRACEKLKDDKSVLVCTPIATFTNR